MKYDLNKLNPTDFEGLIQSLSKRILGNGAISFGAGTDGGREAEFHGSAPFPSTTQSWDGYWVVQAKYKTITIADEEKDFEWIRSQLKKELDKYGDRKVKVRNPDNYLIFTNVVLTAKPVIGGRDKANKLQTEFELKYNIKNIQILSYDDIVNFLDASRDVALAYSPFILPGDVFAKLLDMLDVKTHRVVRMKEIVNRFLKYEFLEDIQAKLDHAGKLTNDKVSLEKVFIDLHATVDGRYKSDGRDVKFCEQILRVGNKINKGVLHSNNRFVLIAGPGYGKSTLTQFLSQIYRVFFVRDSTVSYEEHFDDFLAEFNIYKSLSTPKWIRLPFKIALKEYAGWIADRISRTPKLGVSLLEYIVFNVNRKSSGDISTEELENLLHSFPSIFIFDGLDEVPVTSNRGVVLHELIFFTDTVLRSIEADTILIATTRPQGYSKDFDELKYRHLYITDINTDDCVVYLERLLRKVIDNLDEREGKLGILKEALSNPETARLMRSPLQASIMAILVKSGGNPPRNKFDLFTNYYDTIFRREKQRGISLILKERPEYVHEIHNRLGLYLQCVSEFNTNPSATISKDEFNQIVRQYLIDMGLDSDDVQCTSEEILLAATDRLVFISEIQDEKFGFAIRSLQEYFAALGCLHNFDDVAIRNRIRLICENSYWANTFLFVVGFIAKNKIYLTDFVESICYELNGNSDESDSKSLNSVVKMGSWIALDILNEGVFSGNPKIENKFCNLLEPLFYISHNSKHRDIVKLPRKIILRWVVKFLKEAKTSANKLTVVRVCADLQLAGYSLMNLIKENWPRDQNEIIFTSELISHGVVDLFVVDKFLELIEIKPGSFSNFFNFDLQLHNEFLRIVCRRSMENGRGKKKLFEMIFLSSLSASEEINSDLYDILAVRTREGEPIMLGAVFQRDENMVTIEVIEGYSYDIQKVDFSNDLIDAIFSYAQREDIPLVFNICRFLSEPKEANFLALQAVISSLENSYRSFVLVNLRLVNSFFWSVYSNQGLLRGDWRDILMEIQGIETHLSLRKYDPDFILKIKRHSRHSSFSKENKFAMIEAFWRKYLHSAGSSIAYISYFKLIDVILSDLTKEEVEFLRSDREFSESIKRSISLCFENNDIQFHQMPMVLYFLDVNEVFELIKKYGYPKSRVRILHREIVLWEYGQFTFSKTFHTAVELIEMQLMAKSAPSYCILVQQCFLGFSLFEEIDYSILPARAIERSIVSDDEEQYKAIILILNANMNDSSCLQVESILLNNSILLSDEYYILLILRVLRFYVPVKYVERLLLFLSRNVRLVDRSELDTQIRDFIGSRPSGVEIEVMLD